MATSTQRQPFAELGASRLQSLSSAKNRQNALTEMLASAAKEKSAGIDSKFSFSSPSKRPFSLSVLEDGSEDSENVDPVTSPSIKRSKGSAGVPKMTQPLFALSTDIVDKPISTQMSNPKTPTSPLLHKSSSPALGCPPAPSSAPARTLFKPNRGGLLSKKRSSLSPYKRIDPPLGFKNKTSALPFSIDAAITGTLSGRPTTNARAKVGSLEETMPKGWFFDIYEDTPDEEAAILMEHSTGTLDISSDDEAGPSRKDDRGKENIPPPDFDGPGGSRSVSNETEALARKSRRSAHVDAMVDEGEERAPLGDLPAEDFYAAGLDKTSVEVVAAEPASDSGTSTAEDIEASKSASKDEILLNDENVAPSTLPAPSSPIISSTDVDGPGFVIAEDFVDVAT